MFNKFYGVSLAALAIVMGAGSAMGVPTMEAATVTVSATVEPTTVLTLSTSTLAMGKINPFSMDGELESETTVTRSGSTPANITLSSPSGTSLITKDGVMGAEAIPYKATLVEGTLETVLIENGDAFKANVVLASKQFTIKVNLDRKALSTASAGAYSGSLTMIVVSGS